MAINWRASVEESRLIEAIAARAKALFGESGDLIRDKTHWRMNVTACHLNGCPLDLEGLRAADDFNFAHDMLGIDKHINRETGRLMDHFLPRFAKAEGWA